MKALVVGCGSIGRRHIANLAAMEGIDSISVFTGNKGCLNNLDKKDCINLVHSLESTDADFAVIANNTDLHLQTAMKLAEKGIDLFIEKPLSHGLEDIQLLRDRVNHSHVKVLVGYNLRFLGAVDFIKDQISRRKLGDLYFAKIEVGQFLPSWRPGRDYTASYSASKEKGGGVGLDLSHEIDYMRYFFGDPLNWKVMRGKVSSLDIDSDDLFEGIYRYTGNFICNVHMDYLQEKAKREIRIVGSTGTLVCDFIGKSIRIWRNGSENVINDEEMFDVGRTYIDELKHFIDYIENDASPKVTLDDGEGALRLLECGNA